MSTESRGTIDAIGERRTPAGAGFSRLVAGGEASGKVRKLELAITVLDTEQSLSFYRDGLGLRVLGESENYGPEQEHLNGVFGARLAAATRAGGRNVAATSSELLLRDRDGHALLVQRTRP